MLTARSLMTGPVTAIHPSLSLPELALLFEKEDISGAPVLDDHGVLVGVVSRTDLTATMWRRPRARRLDPVDLDGMMCQGLPSDPVPRREDEGPADEGPPLRARDLMNPEPITVPARMPISEVAQVMARAGVHRVLVTEGREVVGILSSMDFVRLVAGILDPSDLQEAC